MMKIALLAVVGLAAVANARLTPEECVEPFGNMKQCAKVRRRIQKYRLFL